MDSFGDTSADEVVFVGGNRKTGKDGDDDKGDHHLDDVECFGRGAREGVRERLSGVAVKQR